MNLRDIAVEKLGGACARCGYAKCKQALLLAPKSAKVVEKRARSTRDTYYFYAIEHPEEFELVCKNCMTEEMLERRVGKRESRSVARFVWHSSLGVRELEGFRAEWLDKPLSEGAEVLVLPCDGGVYRYPKFERVSETWLEEWGALPKDVMGYV